MIKSRNPNNVSSGWAWPRSQRLADSSRDIRAIFRLGWFDEEFFMTTANEEILERALSLPVDARVELVEKLLGSLNVPTQKDIDYLWKQEAERRVSQIESGEVELVPGEEVFERIRSNHLK